MAKITIATLGSHSALEICEGAKREGIRNMVVSQRGREKTYFYYKTRKRGKKEIGIVDEILLVNRFDQIVEENILKFMLDKNVIFIPNRSFSVYVGYENIEKKFTIPVFGNRFLLKAEERNQPKNQYEIMKKAGIRMPKKISPEKIDRLVIVKAPEAKRNYERAFFLARSYEEYQKRSSELIANGKISPEGLKSASIEEFVIGAQFNFNFFYSPLEEEIELIGIDMRRQTDIDGFLRLPSDQQIELLKIKQPKTIEAGHIAVTIRESLLEHIFSIAEKLVETTKKEYHPGIIGPFAMQGAIVAENKEEFVCFDISFRMPGSPGTRYTPYSDYLFREPISMGRRVVMEIKQAEKERKIDAVTS